MRDVEILLVEDNEGDIVLTLEAFEESKIKTRIHVARNGQEALDFLFRQGAHSQAVRPDLVLLDINLPVYSGHDVLMRIKEAPELKKIPVIMLTTSSSRLDVNRAYEHHVNSFVTKPLDMEGFLTAVLKIEEFWLRLSRLPE